MATEMVKLHPWGLSDRSSFLSDQSSISKSLPRLVCCDKFQPSLLEVSEVHVSVEVFNPYVDEFLCRVTLND